MEKLFRAKDGQIYAYDKEQVAAGLAAGMDQLTASETKAHMTPKPTRQQVEELRLAAYADPFTGSDRYVSEANRLALMGAPESEQEAAKAAAVSRFAEIQSTYPWPTL